MNGSDLLECLLWGPEWALSPHADRNIISCLFTACKCSWISKAVSWIAFTWLPRCSLNSTVAKWNPKECLKKPGINQWLRGGTILISLTTQLKKKNLKILGCSVTWSMQKLQKQISSFLRSTCSCPQPVTGSTELCSTVPLSEAQQRHWLHRMGCEVKVRFCCLINLLSVNLLVCYEIKVNSDEVIKEYFGGQRAGTVTPKLCPGHGREHSLWAAGAEILLSLLQCQLCACAPSLPPAQVVGAVSARIRFIPGPSSSASWCVFRSRDN